MLPHSALVIACRGSHPFVVAVYVSSYPYIVLLSSWREWGVCIEAVLMSWLLLATGFCEVWVAMVQQLQSSVA